MVYLVGVSSGAFGAAAMEERPQLLGLYRKAQHSITQGVQFVQIDLESVSEFEEPGLKRHMEEDITKKLHITFGIHSETKAFGVEAAEIDSAQAIEYERAHRRLIDILNKAGDIGSKYVLIHSSESDPFPLLALRAQPSDLVDFFGRSFDKFLKQHEWLVKWVMEEEGKFLWNVILGRDLDQYLREYKDDAEANYKLNYKKQLAPDVLEKEAKEHAEEMLTRRREELKRYLYDVVKSRALNYGPERWAYYLVAKYMEEKNDPLWRKIIDATLDFFVEREKKSDPSATRQTVLDKKNVKELYSMNDSGFREYHELWVPAVSAKYIWGHLFPEECDHAKEKGKFEDPKPIIKKFNMPLTLESPMGGRGIEEWLRFYNPIQMYYLAEEVNKKAGFDCLQLALDLEHMLSIRLDPETVIKLFPEGGGKIVKVIHAGWPSTLAPAHVPIPLGSEQQQYLYSMYYLLRKKGFGLDPNVNHYILFERGPFPIRESVIALREIVKFLEKGIEPKKLPPEFFGIATGELASEERQRVAIRAHAEEPLKGVIMVPEEEHGLLGKGATEKGKAEVWKKEELK